LGFDARDIQAGERYMQIEFATIALTLAVAAVWIGLILIGL
jgi:hypothetical protein